MSHANKTLVGPRRFQWNAGGWFGSSLGGSAWMLIVACFLGFHNQVTLALVPAIGFVMVSSVSIWLWANRARIFPFSALMILLGLIAIVLPVVWGIVASNASDAALAAMHWPRTIWEFVAGSAIAPTLMIWFFFLEYSTKPHQQSLATQGLTDTT